MRRLRHLLVVRHAHNWSLLLRFGLVGGSGVLVNLVVLVVADRLGPGHQGIFWDPPFTAFNVRWYHVYSTVAFLAANLWNFELNRLYTFRSARHARWWREYLPFLAVGALGQLLSLLLLTSLMHPGSVLALPASVFDGSSGLRTALYWAQFITIAVVTPLSFVLNKLWTCSAVRGRAAALPV